MAWLYLPASVGLNSVSRDYSLNLESFVMSRGKPMQPQSLSRKWKKESYMKHLYGLMLKPSTAQSLVEKWILSVPDSRANLGQKLENSKKLKTKDGYGTILKESFAKLDPHSSSWKTYQVSLTGELIQFSHPWPKWGSMQNGVVSKSPKLVETITEIDCSYSPIIPKLGVTFPTPTVMDSTQDGISMRTVAKESLSKGGWRGISLPVCVRLYPTPTLGDSKNVPYQISNSKKYPTLTGKVENISQKSGLDGGKLNPSWVEWLMGFPIGWTDLEHVGTESFLIKHIEHIVNSSKEPIKV